MLGQFGVWEQFNCDGFKMSDAWAQGPLVGVNEHTDGQLLNGVPHQQPQVSDSAVQADSVAGSGVQASTAERSEGQGYQQHEWWSR